MPQRRHDPEGPSLEAGAGLAVGFFVAYLTAEAALPDDRPMHWLLAAGGAGAGYLVGAIGFHLKERRELYGTFFRRSLSGGGKDDQRRHPRR